MIHMILKIIRRSGDSGPFIIKPKAQAEERKTSKDE